MDIGSVCGSRMLLSMLIKGASLRSLRHAPVQSQPVETDNVYTYLHYTNHCCHITAVIATLTKIIIPYINMNINIDINMNKQINIYVYIVCIC